MSVSDLPGVVEASADPVRPSSLPPSSGETALSAESAAASTPSVIVFSKPFHKGWPEEPDEPLPPEGGAAIAVASLDVALSDDFDTDAHCAQYITTRPIRLKREAVGRIAIHMVALFLDVDDQETHDLKLPATVEWRQTEQLKIDRLLLEQPGVFVHQTNGGYRLIGVLAQPVPITTAAQAEAWSAFYHRTVDEVARRYDIHADKLGDFTRLFRLPFVTRKGEKQQLPYCCGASPLTTPWQLDTKFDASLTLAALNDAPVLPAPPPHPRDPDKALLELEALALHPEHAALMRTIIDGKPLCNEQGGQRHTAMLHASGTLAYHVPSASEDDLLELLAPTLAATQALKRVEEPAIDHMRKLLRTSILSAARLRQENATKRERNKEEFARWREMFRKAARAADPARADAEDALVAAADLEEVDIKTMEKQLVLQYDGAYFLLRAPGEYSSPITRKQLDISFRDWTAAPFGVELTYTNAAGDVKNRVLDDMLRQHTTTAEGIRSSLVAERTRFDVNINQIIEAPLKRRKIEPVFDARVDRWLRLLGGAYQERLLDWIATVDLLDRPSAALYLSGPKSSGKGMMASALTRLWTENGPVLGKDAFGNWNGALLQCPLVFCDEALPVVDGRMVTSATLRELIGNTSHTVRRKFLPNSTLDGSIRFYFADNHGSLLDFDEMLASEDADAIASRFFWITVGTEAAEYLESIGGWKGTEDWVTGDVVPRHFKWLAANRQVMFGSRFLVEGDIGALRGRILTRARLPSLVCEWIVSYMINPKLCTEITNKGDVLFGDGQALVRAGAIASAWEKYIKSDKPRSVESISRVLSSWHRGTTILSGTARKYRTVDGKLLLNWVADAMPESYEDIEAKLTREMVRPPALVREAMKSATAAEPDADAKLA